MKNYHPIRIEHVERLQAKRKDAKAAELQARLLNAMKPGRLGLEEKAHAQNIKEEQQAEEGFDLESSAPWRHEVLTDMSEARELFGERGRNIYDITHIAAMMARVDVDGLVLEEAPLPFEAIYMHFGAEAMLGFGPEKWIEGAYMREFADGDREGIALTFVCNHPDFQATENLPLGLTFKRISTAVTVRLYRDVTVGSCLEEFGFKGDPELLSETAALKNALRMGVNGLLYLNMPRADIEYGYHEEAPRGLVEAASREGPAKSVRAEARLREAGYIRVNFCGRRTVSQTSHAKQGQGPARQTHWRSGHWRRVVVGKGRQGREWRLFPPTIVNKIPGVPVPPRGRVYMVQPRVDAEG